MTLNFFFDIDGTLLPVGKPIPKDAASALRNARSLGHRLFLCTGRSPFELTDEIRSFPFDGGVFSAGAYIKRGDDVVFHGYITEEQKKYFFKVVEYFIVHLRFACYGACQLAKHTLFGFLQAFV